MLTRPLQCRPERQCQPEKVRPQAPLATPRRSLRRPYVPSSWDPGAGGVNFTAPPKVLPSSAGDRGRALGWPGGSEGTASGWVVG